MRCTVAYYFIHLLDSPPKSTWYEVATNIITELKLSYLVNVITSMFHAALINPEHDGKIK